MSTMVLDPADYGLAHVELDALRGGDAAENATISREILSGHPSPRRDVVLLNAGMALVAAGSADDPWAGISMAAESIDSGRALAVLDQLIAFTQEAT